MKYILIISLFISAIYFLQAGQSLAGLLCLGVTVLFSTYCDFSDWFFGDDSDDDSFCDGDSGDSD